jgi:Rrf2 family protein
VLKVNRKIEYSLIALKHMYGKPKDELSTVREICERYGTPFDPLAHVLRVLNTRGVLRSEQGAHGGYRIAANLNELSFADLIEMIEGQLGFTDCIKLGECGCNMTERCNILSPMHAINERLLGFLRTIKVAEIVQTNSPWVPQARSEGEPLSFPPGRTGPSGA